MVAYISGNRSRKVSTSFEASLVYKKIQPVRAHIKTNPLDGDGVHLLFQHLGGRGMRISEFESSLIYIAISRPDRVI